MDEIYSYLTKKDFITPIITGLMAGSFAKLAPGNLKLLPLAVGFGLPVYEAYALNDPVALFLGWAFFIFGMGIFSKKNLSGGASMSGITPPDK